jgi:PAS domain S-box-containing protein
MIVRVDSGVGGAVRALGAVALVSVVAFVLTTVPGVRSDAGFDTLLDGWLKGLAYVMCALVALVPPLTARSDRTLWGLVAAAVAARVAGFVLFVTVVRDLDPVPYPSAADLGWLGACALLLLALVRRLRIQAPRVSTTLVLDALLVALTTTGAAAALLHQVSVQLRESDQPATAGAVNLAYPVSEVALLVVAFALLAAADWLPSTADWVLTVGLVGLVVADSVYVYQVSLGTYEPGTPFAAVGLVSLAAIAFSGWTSTTPGASRGPEPRRPTLAVPVAFALVSVSVFVYAAFTDVPDSALLLSAGGLVVAIVRGVHTIGQDRAEAGHALREKNAQMVQFQTLVETSRDFIAIARLDGTVTYVNPAGRELVGLEKGVEITTTTITDYLTEEGRRASIEVEQPAVIAEGHWEGQSTLRDRRGGPPIPVAISSFLMLHPDSGEPFALATVQRDLRELLAAERALQDLADQRQKLLTHLVQAQEEERERIAADVHDDSVQALAAVDLRLGLLQRSLETRAPEALENLQDLQDTVRAATARLRHLLFDLESPAMGTDLASALREAADYVFEHTDVQWTVTEQHDGTDLPDATRVTAYRIAKEAMVNVAKHAWARQVHVHLTRSGGGLELMVSDDGCGFDPVQLPERPGHLGLASMQDRASIAGGSLAVESAPGQGTRVRLWLPGAALVQEAAQQTGQQADQPAVEPQGSGPVGR